MIYFIIIGKICIEIYCESPCNLRKNSQKSLHDRSIYPSIHPSIALWVFLHQSPHLVFYFTTCVIITIIIIIILDQIHSLEQIRAVHMFDGKLK